MASLDTYLNSLNYSTQLNVIESLLDSAHSTTTFWGSRVVEVNGYTGSVYVDDIAKKILYASRQRCDAANLTPKERISGIAIVRKLRKFYQDTDAKIQKSNSLTKFFNLIRESFLTLLNCNVQPLITNTQSYTENPNVETAERNFRTYSTKKFRKEFGGDFINNESSKTHPAFEGYSIISNPKKGILVGSGIYDWKIEGVGKQRLYVKEQKIWELL
jgi:hypothetical protein